MTAGSSSGPLLRFSAGCQDITNIGIKGTLVMELLEIGLVLIRLFLCPCLHFQAYWNTQVEGNEAPLIKIGPCSQDRVGFDIRQAGEFHHLVKFASDVWILEHLQRQCPKSQKVPLD